MVGGNGVGDVLQQDGLTRLGLGDDEAALALADGREEIDDAGRKVVVVSCAELELLIREEGREVFEGNTVAHDFGLQTVNLLNVR